MESSILLKSSYIFTEFVSFRLPPHTHPHTDTHTDTHTKYHTITPTGLVRRRWAAAAAAVTDGGGV